MNAKIILLVASLLGCLAVISGAFAAHALKTVLAASSLATFETAVKYQMWHSCVLLFVGLITLYQPSRWFYFAAAFFMLGIILFSGSLYFLAMGGPRWLGPITPVGGLCFISAWLLLALGAVKIKL